jgi:hypothetical protein
MNFNGFEIECGRLLLLAQPFSDMQVLVCVGNDKYDMICSAQFTKNDLLDGVATWGEIDPLDAAKAAKGTFGLLDLRGDRFGEQMTLGELIEITERLESLGMMKKTKEAIFARMNGDPIPDWVLGFFPPSKKD